MVPEGNDRRALASTLSKIASNHNTPNIYPHVTLISSFKGEKKYLVDSAEKLATKLTPVYLKFGEAVFTNSFFKSVYISIISSNDIIKMRHTSSTFFKCIEKDYQPHLSIAYGKFTQQEKQMIINDIGVIPIGFSVKRIALAFNDEEALTWRVIKDFSLPGNE